MLEQQRHIDLHLPTGWNQCTTEELEVIAAAIALDTLRADRYHPFDMQAVKLKILLGINHLEVLTLSADNGGDAYLVRFMGVKRTWWHRLFKKQKNEEPFEITTEQLYSIIDQHLAWLDDEKAEPLMRVPYPTLKVKGKTLCGPVPFLDGYTWEQYRYLQDWMQEYMTYTNAISKMKVRNTAKLADITLKAAKAEANFMAVLYHANEELFYGFDPVKWQVILFWWSGLMRYLQKKYPRCFKPEKPGKRSRRHNPLELYTSVIATMQSENKLTEQEINSQSFHIILEQLERLSKQNEEMERMNRKYKSK